MFTGIINHCGKAIEVTTTSAGMRLWCETQFTDLELGESIALNGACLTVTEIRDTCARFDISPETLSLTNLQRLQCGDLLNLERSLRLSDRLGGHFVSGHVDQVADVAKIDAQAEFLLMQFAGISSPAAKKFLVQKGSVTINGVSLTINKLTDSGFEVMLIPHTLHITNLAQLKVNDKINLEFDLLAKLVANQLQFQTQQEISL